MSERQMTQREIQIYQAAKTWLGGQTSNGDYNKDHYGFEAGASWADDNPSCGYHVLYDQANEKIRDLKDLYNALALATGNCELK